MEEIDGWLFSGTKIKSLHFGAKIKSIPTTVFSGVEGIDITISEENPNIKAEEGTYILSKDGKGLIGVSKNLKTYNIPSSVDTIRSFAFYDRSNLNEIVLPIGIKGIGESAFDNSVNLKKVTIQSNIEGIAANAFTRCNSLKEIIIDKKEGEISGAPWSCPYGLRAVFWKK